MPPFDSAQPVTDLYEPQHSAEDYDFTLDSKFAKQQAKEQKELLIRKMRKQSKAKRSNDGY